MKIIVLLPFILLNQILAWLDPRAFKDFDVTSFDNWRRWRIRWVAYVISVAMWAAIVGCGYLLEHLIKSAARP